MAQPVKIDVDFKKMFANINRFFSQDIPKYFKGLAQDMQIAWGVLGLGIVLVIVGIVLL